MWIVWIAAGVIFILYATLKEGDTSCCATAVSIPIIMLCGGGFNVMMEILPVPPLAKIFISLGFLVLLFLSGCFVIPNIINMMDRKKEDCDDDSNINNDER